MILQCRADPRPRAVSPDDEVEAPAGHLPGAQVEVVRCWQVARSTPARQDQAVDFLRFLLSDESSFMTGAEFTVDGGITAAYVTPE